MSTALMNRSTSDHVQSARAIIVGIEGFELSDAEWCLFNEIKPFGFILFKWNIDSPEQLTRLIASLRSVVGQSDLPVLVDQEGGRVVRLGKPHWPHLPAVGQVVDEWQGNKPSLIETLRQHALATGQLVRCAGFNINCAPVLDVRAAAGHDVIGDRTFGSVANLVAECGAVYAAGLREAGVLPVIKHLPGHGRASVDSHYELPLVDAPLSELRQSDFVPFKALRNEKIGMTAHIVFSQIDANRPATTSHRVIQETIRNDIGFTGLLLSDDLTMEALDGSTADRVTQSLEAGCDVVLYCRGSFHNRSEALRCAPGLTQDAKERAWDALCDLARIQNGMGR